MVTAQLKDGDEVKKKSTYLPKLPSPSQPSQGSDFKHQNTSIYSIFLASGPNIYIRFTALGHTCIHLLFKTQSTASHSHLNPMALVFDMMRGRRRSSRREPTRSPVKFTAI